MIDFDKSRLCDPKTFSDKKGRKITIGHDEDYTIHAFHGDKYLGRIEIDPRDNSPDDRHADMEYYITWAYLDMGGREYCHQGIGERILRYAKDVLGATPLTAADGDGIRRSDGSHLTEDGPAFVSSMRQKGLIEPGSYDDPEDDPEY